MNEELSPHVSLVTDQPRRDLRNLVTEQPRPSQAAKEVM
jgi:hypothetical protein